jgi:hypothetical protein
MSLSEGIDALASRVAGEFVTVRAEKADAVHDHTDDTHGTALGASAASTADRWQRMLIGFPPASGDYSASSRFRLHCTTTSDVLYVQFDAARVDGTLTMQVGLREGSDFDVSRVGWNIDGGTFALWVKPAAADLVYEGRRLRSVYTGQSATLYFEGVTKQIGDPPGLTYAVPLAAEHEHGVGDLTATGTPDATTFLRGDNTWASVVAEPPGNVVTTDTSQTITGDKTFSGNLSAGDVFLGLGDSFISISVPESGSSVGFDTSTGAATAGNPSPRFEITHSPYYWTGTASQWTDPISLSARAVAGVNRWTMNCALYVPALRAEGTGGSFIRLLPEPDLAKIAANYGGTEGSIEYTAPGGSPRWTMSHALHAPTVHDVGGRVFSPNNTPTKAHVGLANVDNTSDAQKPVSTAQQTALDLKAPLASPTFTGTVSGVTKSMVGLANVDNTSDAQKPVSTAQQTALDLKANLASPTFTGTVGGITKAMVGLGNVDNTSDANKPVSTAQQTALDLKADLASPTFTGTVAGITKSMVGLGNVDNTSDASKPVSTATQTALDGKAATVHAHVATTDLTATGTKDATTFLRGDDTWATPAAPTNMVTTDTSQTVTGDKTFTGFVGMDSPQITASAMVYNPDTSTEIYIEASNVGAHLITSVPSATATDQLSSSSLQLAGSRWTGAAAQDYYISLRPENDATYGTRAVVRERTYDAAVDFSPLYAKLFQTSGLTGATSAARFVGGTASGAPASGTFMVGDFVVAGNGKIWVCTVAGTPGTWVDGGASAPGNMVTTDTTQTIGGVKTFSSTPVVPDGSFGVAKLSATGTKDATTFLRGDNTFAVPAAPSNMMTTDSAQSITAGVKTFSAGQLLMTSAVASNAEPYSDANPPQTLVHTETTAPSTPASGYGVTFARSADSLLYFKNDAGTEHLLTHAIEPYVMAVTGTLTVATGKSRIYLEGNYVVETIRASVNTAPTGASIIVDVNKNGTTLFTTQSARPTIAASGFTATGTPAVTTFAAGDYMTVDVDQIGSTVAGADLTVTIRLRKTA